MGERWLTVEDVARERGVLPVTIREYVRDAVARPLPGRIPRPDSGLEDPPNRRVLRWRETTIRPWLAAPRGKGGRPPRERRGQR
jgi:hypothetical protein